MSCSMKARGCMLCGCILMIPAMERRRRVLLLVGVFVEVILICKYS
jgi:hypothetical protein